MNKHLLCTTTGLYAALVVFLTTLPTIEVQAAEAATMEEVVVTRTRLREENVEDTPIAVAVVQEETLKELNLVDLDDISDIIPSLDLRTNRIGSMSIRGIGSGGDIGFDSSVSLVIDDVPFSRGIWLTPAYFDVDVIEVLKGPQGVYLGKNATAGAVYIRSKGPSDAPELSFQVGNEFDASNRWAEVIASGPLSDNFRARLALRYNESDGWFDNPVEGNESPEIEEKMARLTLEWDINDFLTNETKFTYNDRSDGGINGVSQKADCPTGAPQPVLGLVPDLVGECEIDYSGTLDGQAPPDFASFGTGRFWDFESWNFTNRLEWQFESFLLTSITSVSDFEMVHQDDYDYASAPVIYAFELSEQRQKNQEFRLLSQFDGNVNFLAGVFWEDTDFTYRQSSVLFGPPFWEILFGNPAAGTDPRNGRQFTWDRSSSQDGRSWGAYAEVSWDITDTVRLDVGGRYTDISKDSYMVNTCNNLVHSALFTLRPEGDGVVDKYEDDNFSPQVTLSWQASDTTMFFASYTEAFKAGGFAHGATLQNQTLDELNFEAESVEGFNIGVKTRFLDESLYVSAVIYDNEFTDLQQNQFNSTTFAFTVANVGTNRSRGLDLDAVWDINEHWQLSGSLTLMDSEIEDYVGTCISGQTVEQGCSVGFDPAVYDPATNSPRGRAQVRDGAELAPDTEATASLVYYTTFGSGYGFTASVSGRYKSEFDTQPERNFPTPSYTRWDVSASITSPDDQWEARVYSRNVTDKLYYRTLGDVPGTGGTSGLPASDPDSGVFADRAANVGQPREIGLVFTYRM